MTMVQVSVCSQFLFKKWSIFDISAIDLNSSACFMEVVLDQSIIPFYKRIRCV